MKAQKFKREILAGHKESAVEVPFDPAQIWGIPPKLLWRGRRGHQVKGTLNGHKFESYVVPRAKRFWMIIDKDLEKAADVSVGDVVMVSLTPAR